MPTNEIEIPGTSLSLRCLTFKTDSIRGLFYKIHKEADQFSIEPETPGFHDCDHDDTVCRGFFSMVVPFEVEHLVEGIVTKTLLKRIETCEFFATENQLFVSGKTSAQKILEHVLAGLTGYGVTAMEFEFRQLSQFQERLTTMKSIGLTNPRDREIRRVRMTGKMETYQEYNVIDPKNHGIETVSGLIDSPLGPLTLTVNRKGVLKLSVKRGFILTVECLLWLLAMVREEKPPAGFQNRFGSLQKSVEKLKSFGEKHNCSVTFETPGMEPVTIGSLNQQVEGVLDESGIPYQKGGNP